MEVNFQMHEINSMQVFTVNMLCTGGETTIKLNMIVIFHILVGDRVKDRLKLYLKEGAVLLEDPRICLPKLNLHWPLEMPLA